MYAGYFKDVYIIFFIFLWNVKHQPQHNAKGLHVQSTKTYFDYQDNVLWYN